MALACMRTMIALKRAYEPFEKSDGYRVLVDRLWPRGVRKEQAHLDAWLKPIAPSDELRRSFGHDPRQWSEFRLRYRRELRSEGARELIEELAERAQRGTVTLVYAAHDEMHNNAIVLREVIERARAVTGGRRRSRVRRAPRPLRPPRRHLAPR
jgi:uncharacterized protein YeaO (DUF488 family)